MKEAASGPGGHDSSRNYKLVECDAPFCDRPFPRESGFDGHCTPYCNTAHQGYNFLQHIKHDHRFCFSCFARLKEIERPPEDTPSCVVGFQYATPSAGYGEITLTADTTDTVVTGLICSECGTTDHQDDYLRDLSPTEAAKRLRRRIKETRAEGQHDKIFKTADFVTAWNETHAWSYAVGSAISESESR